MKQQSAILFVSHDDAAIRTLCDELLVMQNGTIAERGTTGSLFASPREEWTKEFVRARQYRGRRWLDMEQIAVTHVSKDFPIPPASRFLPCVTSFTWTKGENISLMGESGAGKARCPGLLLAWSARPRAKF